MITVCQKTKNGNITGRNGTFANKEVVIWEYRYLSNNMIVFDCKGKRGTIIKGGFSMDKPSFLALIEKIKAEIESEV